MGSVTCLSDEDIKMMQKDISSEDAGPVLGQQPQVQPVDNTQDETPNESPTPQLDSDVDKYSLK